MTMITDGQTSASSDTAVPAVPASTEVVGVDQAAAEGTLRVTDLEVAFRRGALTIEAVRGISFAVEPGKTLVLLGESGSGKSVSARSVMRLYGRSVAITGQVSLGQVDLLSLPEAAMQDVRGRAIALVPQDASGTLD